MAGLQMPNKSSAKSTNIAKNLTLQSENKN